MLTDCDCAPSTPVVYACIEDADTGTSCPWPFSCASTQMSPSSLKALSRLSGACANTKTLACVPTSCARGWICALAEAVVELTLPVTSMGNTGDCVATLAVKFPFSARGVPSWCVAATVIVPDEPSHPALKVQVTPGAVVYVQVPSGLGEWKTRFGSTCVPEIVPGCERSRPVKV